MADSVKLHLICPKLFLVDEMAHQGDIAYACKFRGPVTYLGHNDHITYSSTVFVDPDENGQPNVSQLRCTTHDLAPLKVYQVRGYWQQFLESEFSTQFHRQAHGFWTRGQPDPNSFHNRWETLLKTAHA